MQDYIRPTKNSDMEFTKRVACPRPLIGSMFSVKNILNLQHDGSNVVDFPRLQAKHFDDALSSKPRSIVAPVPCKPSPLTSPCASFGLPLYAPPVIWTSIGTRMDTPIWTSNTNFMMNQFSSGKCTCLVCLEYECFFSASVSS